MTSQKISRGALIAAKRKQLDYTQQQVADAAGITQQSYAAIELDQVSNPRRPILRAIAKMLDIPIETLVLNDTTINSLSEAAVQVGREYDRLPPDGKLRVMQAILQSRGVQSVDDPVSERTE